MRNKACLLALPLLLLCTFAKSEEGANWKNKIGAGGYVGFAHYPVADTDTHFNTQGLSAVFGLTPKLRVGGNFGVFVAHRGGDTGGTATGFSIAPTLQYDVVSKAGGSLYLVTHSMGFDMVKNSGNTSDSWALNILNAGVGIEALASRDVGISMEGDFFNFGMSRAVDHTETHVDALAFPAIRLIARMYF